MERMRMRPASAIALGLVLLGAHGAAATTAQVPPSLVFERGGDLWRMTIDGSETVRLTTTQATERSPAVSPERLRIAYSRGDELWLMDANGVNQKKVLAARPSTVRYAVTDSPSWAPDGRSMYVGRSAQGPNEICGWIYRIGADGRGLRKLTRGVTLDSDPAVSPNGGRIAFITSECQPAGACCYVAVVDTAGRPTRDLRKLPAHYSYEGVGWSPDGRRVVLDVNIDDDEVWAVFVADRDGSGLRRITPRGLNAESAAWSPDGEWIAFAAWTRSRSYDLYVIRPDGSGLRRLTTSAAAEHEPAWLLRT
jgi:TolB protein